MLVLAHADDERDALLLRFGGKICQRQEQGNSCNEQAMHGVRPLRNGLGGAEISTGKAAFP